jgi:hypothetical protein
MLPVEELWLPPLASMGLSHCRFDIFSYWFCSRYLYLRGFGLYGGSLMVFALTLLQYFSGVLSSVCQSWTKKRCCLMEGKEKRMFGSRMKILFSKSRAAGSMPSLETLICPFTICCCNSKGSFFSSNGSELKSKALASRKLKQSVIYLP